MVMFLSIKHDVIAQIPPWDPRSLCVMLQTHSACYPSAKEESVPGVTLRDVRFAGLLEQLIDEKLGDAISRGPWPLASGTIEVLGT